MQQLFDKTLLVDLTRKFMQAGRTLYVSQEIQSSVPDPGAYATASWYSAAAQAIKDNFKNK
jgi:hypothetical protein